MNTFCQYTSKDAPSVSARINELRALWCELFTNVFRSITADNGSKFAEMDALLRLWDFHVYFAHSYSSWEQGTNERHNGLIRRFIPKKTSMTNVHPATILRV